LPSDILTWAPPIATGISPPLSTIRPALISRSDSLCMASIRAGVGPRIGWDEVTTYMKRIEKLPLRRAAATIAAKLSRFQDDER